MAKPVQLHISMKNPIFHVWVRLERLKEMAKEVCAVEVVAFLTKIVEEDEYWTVGSQQKLKELGQKFWEERSELANTSQRLLNDAPSPMLTDPEEGELL